MDKLIPIEYKNQRVLTTQQLAEGYEVSPDKIKQNYSNNKGRYIQGVHYFILEGEDLRQFKSEVENFDLAPNVNRFFLWTERGAFRHAKSLNTNNAWEVYDSLVENYFKSKEVKDYISSEKLSPQTQLLLQLSQSIAKAELEQQEITIVFMRYAMLALESRNSKDPRTIGDLFFYLCDKVEDIKFSTSLMIVIELLWKVLNEHPIISEEDAHQIMDAFILALPAVWKQKLKLSA